MTFLRLPERHQDTLDELNVLMQRFPRLITDSLGKGATSNHPSTSVYTETTSIRNNLLRILIPKISIFVKKKFVSRTIRLSTILT